MLRHDRCGPGALTGELVKRLGPAAVSAVDPSDTFVTAVLERYPGVDARRANDVLAPIHDRMPVMLPPEHWAAWLSRGVTDPDALAPLMQGLPDTGPGAMQAWPVARTVGRSSNDGPGLIDPLPVARG